MTLSKEGLNLIKKFEGYRSNAYLDSVGIPTIGFGSTMWSDGKKVKLGEVISMEGAEKLLAWEVNRKTASINSKLTKPVNQNQFDALCSLIYNIGVGAFSKSTLLKKINNNPSDPDIKNQFLRWSYAGGVQLSGLLKRRAAEAALYFKPTL